jgi:exopolysaccharide biosynthesis polyprenyl glycosylphosphotransferase
MLEQHYSDLRRAVMIADISVTTAAYVIACVLRFTLMHASIDLLSHLALLGAIIPLWFLLLPYFGGYDSPHTASRRDYLWAVVRAVAAGLAVVVTGLFLLRIQHVSRAVVLIFAVLDVAALFAVRLGMIRVFHRSIERMEHVRRLLIIGTGARAIRLAEALFQKAELGIHVIGHLDPDPSRVGSRVLGSPVLGTLDDIGGILRDHIVDQVLIAIPPDMLSAAEKVARACEEEGISYCLMADVFDAKVARMSLVPFGSISLLSFEPVFQDELRLLVKRILDLAATIVVLPLILPLIGLIAMAIKLDSSGSVFFAQDRVGHLRRRFKMLKFRTMVDGADKLMHQVEHLNEAGGPIFKIRNDPRITRVGQFLRRTSLDELPQLFNVLRGDMSLVGPRPMSVRDVQLFDQGIQRRRFSVKPGLTCLREVSGRSLLPFSKWLELDLYYIDHWSLSLDLQILLRTIPVVLKGTGAV